MKEMDKDLVKIDADILALRDEYHKKKRSLTRIVQKLMWIYHSQVKEMTMYRLIENQN